MGKIKKGIYVINKANNEKRRIEIKIGKPNRNKNT
jgi:TnpA family transposase